MKKEPETALAPVTLYKIPTLKTGNDAEVAARFVELFKDAQTGLRRVVAFGLYAWHVKLNCLRHSQFLPWTEGIGQQHGISYRSVNSHMNLTKSVLGACGVKSLKPFMANWQSQICSALHISRCGDLLLLPIAEIPKQFQPLREKICSLIDGKSARQLFFEFKQADEDGEVKHGRNKGCKGTSKAQRDAAKAAEEAGRRKALAHDSKAFRLWIDKYCDATGFGTLPDAEAAALEESCRLAAGFLHSLNTARKGPHA